MYVCHAQHVLTKRSRGTTAADVPAGTVIVGSANNYVSMSASDTPCTHMRSPRQCLCAPPHAARDAPRAVWQARACVDATPSRTAWAVSQCARAVHTPAVSHGAPMRAGAVASRTQPRVAAQRAHCRNRNRRRRLRRCRCCASSSPLLTRHASLACALPGAHRVRRRRRAAA
jgi:hypothetical protein